MGKHIVEPVMKAVLYMSLTANGCYAVRDESHPMSSLPKEVLNNFAQNVGKIGNLITGRKTYELFPTQMTGIRHVVISHSPLNYNGISVVASL